VDIDGGAVDGTTIGGTTPAAGTFTNLTATGTADLGSNVNIDGGSIDGTTIGATSQADGTFDNLTAGGSANLGSSVDIDGGSIDGTTIGGSSTAPGSFSNLNASGTVTMPGIGMISALSYAVVWQNGELRKAGSVSPSSVRYKEDITPLEDDFQKIMNADAKSFVFKASGDKGIGFIAEEFDALGLNNLVIYQKGQPDGIKYELVSLYLLEVMKEQVKVTNELKAENESLKQRLQAVEQAMQAHQLSASKEANK
jgi:hypothetical protein